MNIVAVSQSMVIDDAMLSLIAAGTALAVFNLYNLLRQRVARYHD